MLLFFTQGKGLRILFIADSTIQSSFSDLEIQSQILATKETQDSTSFVVEFKVIDHHWQQTEL